MSGPVGTMRETLERALEAASVTRVFGEPIERDGVTVVPVAKVRAAWGGGGSDVPGSAGLGGGVLVTSSPAGVYEIRPGQVRWVPALDVNRAILFGQLAFMLSMLVFRSVASRRAKGG